MSHYKSGFKMESSSEGNGSVSEIEELRKRMERLGRNSTENYTLVDSTCLSGQPSNLKNGSFSSAVRSKQYNGNDEIQIPETCMFYPLPTGNEPMMNQFKISRVKEEDVDAVFRRIRSKYSMEKLECKIKKINEGKFYYNTSENESNLKKLREAEVVELKNRIQNLRTTLRTRYNLTGHNYTPVDSTTKGGQPSSLLGCSFSTADGLEQHHGRKKSVIRDKYKWKPYHKLTGYERLDEWHNRRAVEDSFKLFVDCVLKKHKRYNVNSSEDKVHNIESSENKIDCTTSENEFDIKVEGVGKLKMENAFKNVGK